MSKPFELGQALAGQYVKIKGTEEPRRIVGKSHFRNEYIIEDEYSAYRLSLESIQDGFEMWGEPNLRIQLNLPCPVLQLEVGKTLFVNIKELFHIYLILYNLFEIILALFSYKRSERSTFLQIFSKI